jgi:hypothetical protein
METRGYGVLDRLYVLNADKTVELLEHHGQHKFHFKVRPFSACSAVMCIVCCHVLLGLNGARRLSTMCGSCPSRPQYCEPQEALKVKGVRAVVGILNDEPEPRATRHGDAVEKDKKELDSHFKQRNVLKFLYIADHPTVLCTPRSQLTKALKELEAYARRFVTLEPAPVSQGSSKGVLIKCRDVVGAGAGEQGRGFD